MGSELLKVRIPPGIQLRFIVAILLTFFPLGLLFPLQWPTRELVTLLSWVAVFPGVSSCLPLLAVPLLLAPSYDYFAFNLVCFGTSLGIAKAMQDNPRVNEVLRCQPIAVTRACLFVTYFLATWQALTSTDAWQRVFAEMSLGDGGRGAGLRTEPSLLAAPLMLYLALLVSTCGEPYSGKNTEWRLPLGEMLLASLYALAVTRSLSVLLVVICFIPLFVRRITTVLLGLPVGIALVFVVFAARIKQAFVDTGGSLLAVVTVGVASWRNVPDLLVLLNFDQFLFPGKPDQIRDQISSLATLWDPSLSWLQNTYSTFSAGATTLGIVVVGICFIAGIAFGWRVLRRCDSRSVSWSLLYLANWFLTPKFELAGWVALGFVTIAFSHESTSPQNQLLKANRSLLAQMWGQLRFRPEMTTSI